MNIGSQEVTFYSNISEMPYEQWQEFNNKMLLVSNVGSDIFAFISHTNKIANMIKADEKDKALQSLRNMELSVNNIYENFSSSLPAFKLIIKHIDGKNPTEKTMDKLLKSHEITYNLITNEILEVKKKLKVKSSCYFPAIIKTLINSIITSKRKLKKEPIQ